MTPMRAKHNWLVSTALAAALCALPAAIFAARDTSTATAAKATPAKHPVAKSKKKAIARKRTPPAQMAPTPARISEIQAALAKAGTYQGDPNGRWDAPTIDAYSHFQSSHGLTATGKLDALTLQKLGLGSEVAGRAAPLPSQTAAPSRLQPARPPADSASAPAQP